MMSNIRFLWDVTHVNHLKLCFPTRNIHLLLIFILGGNDSKSFPLYVIAILAVVAVVAVVIVVAVGIIIIQRLKVKSEKDNNNTNGKNTKPGAIQLNDIIVNNNKDISQQKIGNAHFYNTERDEKIVTQVLGLTYQ